MDLVYIMFNFLFQILQALILPFVEYFHPTTVKWVDAVRIFLKLWQIKYRTFHRATSAPKSSRLCKIRSLPIEFLRYLMAVGLVVAQIKWVHSMCFEMV